MKPYTIDSELDGDSLRKNWRGNKNRRRKLESLIQKRVYRSRAKHTLNKEVVECMMT